MAFFRSAKKLLLASLPEREYSELLPHLALVSLDTGSLLHAGTADRPVIFFPTDAIVSVLHLIRDGRSVEVAVIGNPNSVTTARQIGASGTRSATLPVLAVTRSGSLLPAFTTMVSGPGQNFSASRSKALSMGSTATLAVGLIRL